MGSPGGAGPGGVVKKGTRTFYLIMAIMSLGAIILYPILVKYFINKPVFMQSWPVFCILTVGMWLSIGYKPFNMFLTQTGHPAYQTILIALTIFATVSLNVLLIPFFGMHGAAVATGTSFVLSVFFLKILVNKATGLKI